MDLKAMPKAYTKPLADIFAEKTIPEPNTGLWVPGRCEICEQSSRNCGWVVVREHPIDGRRVCSECYDTLNTLYED
jgi:hypothetical protein